MWMGSNPIKYWILLKLIPRYIWMSKIKRVKYIYVHFFYPNPYLKSDKRSLEMYEELSPETDGPKN